MKILGLIGAVLVAIACLAVAPGMATDSVIFHHSGFGNYTYDGQDQVTASVRTATDVVHLMSINEIPDSVGYTKDGAEYTITTTGTSFKGYIDYTNDGYVVIMTRKRSSLKKGDFVDIISTFRRTNEPATYQPPIQTISEPVAPPEPTFITKLPGTIPGFPLVGGNGVTTATIYGIMTDVAYEKADHNVYVDLSVTDHTHGSYWDKESLVQLVDSTNHVYDTYQGESGNFGAIDGYPRYNESVRGTLTFNIPTGTVIKEIKVTKDGSDPIYIELPNIYEVPHTTFTHAGQMVNLPYIYNSTNQMASLDGITITLLKAQRTNQVDGQSYSGKEEYTWAFDMMLTNTRKTSTTFAPSDFSMLDATGWLYKCDYMDMDYNPNNKIVIGPNQSQQFQVKIDNVGQFSRPAEIAFNGVSMDVGAWT